MNPVRAKSSPPPLPPPVPEAVDSGDRRPVWGAVAASVLVLLILILTWFFSPGGGLGDRGREDVASGAHGAVQDSGEVAAQRQSEDGLPERAGPAGTASSTPDVGGNSSSPAEEIDSAGQSNARDDSLGHEATDNSESGSSDEQAIATSGNETGSAAGADGAEVEEELLAGSAAAPIGMLSRSAAPAGQVTQNPVSGASGKQSGGGGDPIRFFGNVGEGRNIVFVIDHSNSMAGSIWHDDGTGTPASSSRFEVACRELMKAVSALRPDQKVTVVLFNEAWSGHQNLNCCPARKLDQTFLATWLSSNGTTGGTDPTPALEAVFSGDVGRGADLIFLLSDGEFDPFVVEWIRTLNKGRIPIHTVSIGSPAVTLKQIARDSGGRSVTVLNSN